MAPLSRGADGKESVLHVVCRWRYSIKRDTREGPVIVCSRRSRLLPRLRAIKAEEITIYERTNDIFVISAQISKLHAHSASEERRRVAGVSYVSRSKTA